MDLRGARDLAELEAVVERRRGQWVEDGNVAELRAAFYILIKLCGQPRADPDSSRAIMQRLAEAYLPLVPRLHDAHSCVAALYACAKLRYWEGGLAGAVLEKCKDPGLWRGATGQSHANMWWAISEAPAEVAVQAQEVLAISAAHLGRMPAEYDTSQGWSNVLLACARLQYGRDPGFLRHATACLASKPDIKPQELANSLYSLGELAEDCGHHPQPGDLQLLTGRVAERLRATFTDAEHFRDSHRAFIPQGLSNMLLGCAKLGYTEPELLQPLVDAAGCAAAAMKHQELANSLYALGRLGCGGEVYAPAVQRFMMAAGSRLQNQAEGFVPQALSNMLLGLEGLQKPQGWDRLAAALAEECRQRGFAGFRPQALSNSVWALAKMGWGKEQDWYDAAVKAAKRPGLMDGAVPQDWSNLLHGLAMVRHRPQRDLLRVVGGGVQGQGSRADNRSQANSQGCAVMLWALAVLGLHSEQRLVDALAGRLGELLRCDREQLVGQGVANSLWALAVMGPQVLRRHSVLVDGLLREAAQRWEQTAGQPDRSRPFAVEELAQLWQVQQELMPAAGTGGGGGVWWQVDSEPPDDGSCRYLLLLEAARGAAQKERLGAGPNPSQLQNEVVQALTMLVQGQPRGQQGSQSPAGRNDGDFVVVSVIQEYEVPALCCRVDVLVGLEGGRQVAVEVDGPSHFLANEPHTRTKDGGTQLRDRQLERVFGEGNVVSIPYWEWNELGTGVAQGQEQYLRRLLGLPVVF